MPPRDPILQDILAELRKQAENITQLRLDFAMTSATMVELKGLPERVSRIENKLATQEAVVKAGWWVWMRLVGAASLIASGAAWLMDFMFHRN